MRNLINLKYKTRNKVGGRNNKGRITIRGRGFSKRKRNVCINFNYSSVNETRKIIKIEKDSYRTAFISLVLYNNCGIFEYILAHTKAKINGLAYIFPVIEKMRQYSVKHAGISGRLKIFRVGSFIFNVERNINTGGSLVRAAGNYARIIQKIQLQNSVIFVGVKLRSKKIVYISGNCYCSLGQVSNTQHHTNNLKKAGFNRLRGFRPIVRGVAKNPVDHPHGGGEGKTSGGRISVTPWGKLTKGKKTLRLKVKRQRIKCLLKLKKGSFIK